MDVRAQTIPLIIWRISYCLIKHSVILVLNPGAGTFDFGWVCELVTFSSEKQTGSWILRSNRGRIINFAAIKQLIVTICCSTYVILLGSVMFSENPTHNTFKRKKNLLFFLMVKTSICPIVIFLFFFFTFWCLTQNSCF